MRPATAPLRKRIPHTILRRGTTIRRYRFARMSAMSDSQGLEVAMPKARASRGRPFKAGVPRRRTTLSLPVMTRLRQPERQVLDTLIAAGVARSRSEALNWCVRLVAEKQAEWLKDLKSALQAVEKARAKGPKP